MWSVSSLVHLEGQLKSEGNQAPCLCSLFSFFGRLLVSLDHFICESLQLVGSLVGPIVGFQHPSQVWHLGFLVCTLTQTTLDELKEDIPNDVCCHSQVEGMQDVSSNEVQGKARKLEEWAGVFRLLVVLLPEVHCRVPLRPPSSLLSKDCVVTSIPLP